MCVDKMMTFRASSQILLSMKKKRTHKALIEIGA